MDKNAAQVGVQHSTAPGPVPAPGASPAGGSIVQPPRDAPLLTRSDVAALLRTTPRQISNMIARGQLTAPLRGAGLGLRWRRPAIDAWIAAH